MLVPLKYAKGEMILSEGEICKSIYYIEKGLVRQFYYKYDKELTEHLGVDHTICMCIESLFKEEPTHLQMEALEPTLLYALPKNRLEAAAMRNVNIQMTEPLSAHVQGKSAHRSKSTAQLYSQLLADDTRNPIQGTRRHVIEPP